MYIKIFSIKQLKEFAKAHSDYALKEQNLAITNADDRYWHGVNSAYINMYNAITSLEKRLSPIERLLYEDKDNG